LVFSHRGNENSQTKRHQDEQDGFHHQQNETAGNRNSKNEATNQHNHKSVNDGKDKVGKDFSYNNLSRFQRRNQQYFHGSHLFLASDGNGGHHGRNEHENE